MKKLLLAIFFIAASLCYADSYFVYFRDKAGTEYALDRPEEYLSKRAIERRQRQGIAIDSTDLPVSKTYTDSIRSYGCEIVYTSRWHNGATIRANDSIAAIIGSLLFVDSIEVTSRRSKVEGRRSKVSEPLRVPLSHSEFLRVSPSSSEPLRVSPSSSEPLRVSQSLDQTKQLQLDILHSRGYRGKSMLIAVVDNGFLNLDNIAAFDLMRENIIDTLNLVPENGGLYTMGTHGMYVTSIMAATLEDSFEGAATEAQYALIRSEDDNFESKVEQDNQVRAFEFADSIGADIINSSLGYFFSDDSTLNLSHNDLDGRSQRNSLAATIAARKGMVVCIAAGNEYNKEWQQVDTPADADSILTVGSVDVNNAPSFFSSRGLTADGRIKPDIMTMGEGTCVIALDGQPSRGNGTSFASPVAAGMVACLWSALPNLTNMEIIERIKQFASNANSPNIDYGWGIPNILASLSNGDETRDFLQKSTDYDSNISSPRKAIINNQMIILMPDGSIYDVLGHLIQ